MVSQHLMLPCCFFSCSFCTFYIVEIKLRSEKQFFSIVTDTFCKWLFAAKQMLKCSLTFSRTKSINLFPFSRWWRWRIVPGWRRSCPGSRDSFPAGSCTTPRWWSSRCRGKLLGRWRRSDRGFLPGWWASRWHRRKRWCPKERKRETDTKEKNSI